MRVLNNKLTPAMIAMVGATLLCVAAEAGPNSWTALGPDGGRVERVIGDPGDANRYYAKARGAGVFISDDAGTSWQRLAVSTADIVDANITDIEIDPLAPMTLYAVDYGQEVARSDDRGLTWTTVGNGIDDAVWHLEHSPVQSGRVFAYERDALFVSDDRGDNFSRIDANLGMTVINDLFFHPSDADTFYAVGWDGVFKTTDAGATWLQQLNGLPAPNSSGYVFANFGAIDPTATNTAYVQISNRGVYKTTDGGAFWFSSGATLPLDFFTTMKFDPSNSERIFMASGNNDVLYSPDAGASWQILANNGLGNYTVNDIAIDPTDPNRLLIATGNKGLFVSTDSGLNWAPSSSGYVNENVESVAFSTIDGRLYLGVSGGTSVSDDGGQTWQSNGGDYDLTTFAIHADPDLAGHAYAGSSCCGLYETFDGGTTWARINLGIASLATWVTDIDIPETDTQRLYFTDYNRGLFATRNGGNTWQDLTPALSGFFSGNVVLQGVDASPSAPGTIYVTSAAFGSYGVFKSSDDGATFARLSGGGTLPGPAFSYDVAVHPTNADRVVVAQSGGISYSDDGGANWTFVLIESFVKMLRLYQDYADPNLMYTVGDTGSLYRSIDAGLTWTTAPVSAGPYRLNALGVDPAQPGKAIVGFDNIGAQSFSFATDLVLAATQSTTTPAVDDTFTVNIAIDNSGPYTATRTEVSVTAAAGLALISATPSQGSCSIDGQTLTCALGHLDDAQTIDVTAQAIAAGSADLQIAVAAREAELEEADNAATISVTVEGDTDSDGDGVADSLDNCTLAANPGQQDGDGDGYGNACDADLNNDCLVNVVDLGMFRSVFFMPDASADFNGDGVVNVVDLGYLRSVFFGSPGPSALSTACD